VTVQPAAANKQPALHVMLVDGSGFLWRAFHGFPDRRHSDGTPTNAVLGFVSMVLRPIIERAKTTHIAILFDTDQPTFRHELYPAYKGERPPPPDDIVVQFPLTREATRAFGLPCIEQPGYEADDLIATYTRATLDAGGVVTVVSSDKDLMQLLRPGVRLYDPHKKLFRTPDDVEKKFGVRPERVVDVQALAGDSTDGIPGVPKIGIKTAAELITRFGSLEGLLASIDEIAQPKRRQQLREHTQDARISKQLATLKDDVPLEVPLHGLAVKGPDLEAVRAFVDRLELGSAAIPRSWRGAA